SSPHPSPTRNRQIAMVSSRSHTRNGDAASVTGAIGLLKHIQFKPLGNTDRSPGKIHYWTHGFFCSAVQKGFEDGGSDRLSRVTMRIIAGRHLDKPFPGTGNHDIETGFQCTQ